MSHTWREWAIASAVLALGAAPAARAQTDSTSPAAPPAPARHGTPPAQLSGDITTTGQLYGAAGIPDRWPGQSWSIDMNPEATLFGTFHLGFGLSSLPKATSTARTSTSSA